MPIKARLKPESQTESWSYSPAGLLTRNWLEIKKNAWREFGGVCIRSLKRVSIKDYYGLYSLSNPIDQEQDPGRRTAP